MLFTQLQVEIVEQILPIYSCTQPTTVVTWSKAWIVFACSNAGIVGSNPTQGMNVCVCVYSVFVLSCV
jgi:hypothetical protein